MSVLLVTYDLPKKGQNYDGVLGIIKKYSYAQLSESSYAIDTTETPNSVFEKLEPFLDGNDKLYVITLSLPRMGKHTEPVRNWIKVHLH